MPYLIEICCYSFNESEESFHRFLTAFKEGTKAHFNHLLLNNFSGLLQSILDATKEMRPNFFKTLDSAAIALEKGFQFLQQRKIDGFSASTIEFLVKDDDEALSHISARPSMIIENSMPKLSALIRDIQRLNPDLELCS
jgi:hypothetical protein